MSGLKKEETERGVVCASAGNHAQVLVCRCAGGLHRGVMVLVVVGGSGGGMAVVVVVVVVVVWW